MDTDKMTPEEQDEQAKFDALTCPDCNSDSLPLPLSKSPKVVTCSACKASVLTCLSAYEGKPPEVISTSDLESLKAKAEKWGTYRNPANFPPQTGVKGFKRSLPDGTLYPNAPAFIQDLGSRVTPGLTCSDCGATVTWENSIEVRRSKRISNMFRQPPMFYQIIARLCYDCNLNQKPTVVKSACPACYKRSMLEMLCEDCLPKGHADCWRCRKQVKGIMLNRHTEPLDLGDGRKDPNRLHCQDCNHVFESHEEVINNHLKWD